MKEVKIKLGLNDVKDFCDIVSRIDGDIDLCSDRYVIDAKSIMGIMSLNLSKTLTCAINAINAEEERKAVEAIRKWQV